MACLAETARSVSEAYSFAPFFKLRFPFDALLIFASLEFKA